MIKVDKWVKVEVKGVTYKVWPLEIPYLFSDGIKNVDKEPVSHFHHIHDEVSFILRFLETSVEVGGDQEMKVDFRAESEKPKKEGVKDMDREKEIKTCLKEMKSEKSKVKEEVKALKLGFFGGYE